MSKISELNSIIQESVREALTENVNVKRVILENRLALINKILDQDESLNEGMWQNMKKWWKGYDDSDLEKDPSDPTADYMMGRPDGGYRSQAHTPGGGGETGYKTNPGVAAGVTELDPSAVVDNPEQSAKIVSKAVAQGKSSVAKFKANTVKSATAISGLQDSVEDMFGQFYNLINSLPQESRGVLERDVMQVMGSFYATLTNEKAVIQTALNGLFVKAMAKGYNLAQSGEAMAKYRPGQEAEVESPAPARAPVRNPAQVLPGRVVGATEE